MIRIMMAKMTMVFMPMMVVPATTHGKRGLGLRRPVALMAGRQEVEEGGDAAEGERVRGWLARGNQQAVLGPEQDPE